MHDRPSVPLAADTLHLWRVDLDAQPGARDSLESLLSPDELDRASRFRFQADRRRFVVARGVLRQVLSAHTGLPAPSLRFSYSDAGKPDLDVGSENGGVRFNVSHSHELALIAVGLDARIGVDIERVRAIDDVGALVHRYFSQDEVAAFEGVPGDERMAAFFRCWTRKEAYLKATGAGVADGLEHFAVSLGGHEAPRLLHIRGSRALASRWRLEDVAPSADYAATLAVERADWQLVVRSWVADGAI